MCNLTLALETQCEEDYCNCCDVFELTELKDIGSCLFKTESLSQNEDFFHETNTNCNVQSVSFSI